jgi:hypothetical protein
VSVGALKGLPGKIIHCKEGNPACDFGPAGDGICSFRIAMCFNVADRRLGCDGSSTIEKVGARRPDFDRARSGIDKANSEALMKALVGVGGVTQAGADGRHAAVVFNPPISTPGTCTSFFLLQAPLKRTSAGFAQNRTPIRIRIFPGVDPKTGKKPHYDGDELDLICEPGGALSAGGGTRQPQRECSR